jgi:ketosteroid isomerase-like protein
MDLREIADRLALRELVDRYARIPDQRDFALVDRVFSDDAVLVGPGFELRGREQIRSGMRGIERYAATLHAMHNHLVEIEGDHAEGETVCTASHLHEVEGRKVKLDWGIRYRDRYRRERLGWRIVHRELELVFEQELPLRFDDPGQEKTGEAK